MSGARFVRFYPSDWRSGCMGLSLEQEGFYIRLCAYVYETGQRAILTFEKGTPGERVFQKAMAAWTTG